MLRDDHELVVSRRSRRRCHCVVHGIADGTAHFLRGRSVDIDADKWHSYSFLISVTRGYTCVTFDKRRWRDGRRLCIADPYGYRGCRRSYGKAKDAPSANRMDFELA